MKKDTDTSQDDTPIPLTPTEHVEQHLLRNPSDLIDARRLLRCFRASPEDVMCAIAQVEARVAQQMSSTPSKDPLTN